LRNLIFKFDRVVFDPNELEELGVAFENCCAAMPEARSPQFRNVLAKQLVAWAAIGAADGTQLYIRALNYYRSLQAL
jgi:hypothetical protein